MVISGSISLSGMLTNAIKRGHRVIDHLCVTFYPAIYVALLSEGAKVNEKEPTKQIL